MNANLFFVGLSIVFVDLANGMSAKFKNPCYDKGYTAQNVDISNGAVLNFASKGAIGNTIRSATSVNQTPNDLGLTHTGIAIVDEVMYVYDLANNVLRTGDESVEKYAKYAIDKIDDEFSKIIDNEDTTFVSAFALESNGSASQVLQGIFPHVQISPLKSVVKEYNGNVYFRNLHTPLSASFTRGFLGENIFRPYEIYPMELLKATKGLNSEEKTEHVFCSEFAALVYKQAEVIEPTNVSNVLPEHFSHLAMRDDILGGFAYNDVPLKYTFNATRAGERGFFGRLVAGAVNLFTACSGK